MNYSDLPEETRSKFLHDVGLREYGFRDKTLGVFELRYDPKNEEQTNATLAEQVFGEKVEKPVDGNKTKQPDKGLSNPPEAFQYYLKIINTKLSERGKFEINTHRGRSSQGEEPWRRVFEWLWETEFDEWYKQQQLQENKQSGHENQINCHNSTGYQFNVKGGVVNINN